MKVEDFTVEDFICGDGFLDYVALIEEGIFDEDIVIDALLAM